MDHQAGTIRILFVGLLALWIVFYWKQHRLPTSYPYLPLIFREKNNKMPWLVNNTGKHLKKLKAACSIIGTVYRKDNSLAHQRKHQGRHMNEALEIFQDKLKRPGKEYRKWLKRSSTSFLSDIKG